LGAGVFTWQYGRAARGTASAEADSGGRGVAAAEKRPAKQRAYVIEPPDVLLVGYPRPDSTDPVKVAGECLVRPDGTIGLGQLGSVFVAGLTPEQARGAIAKHLAHRLDGFDPKKLTVNVLASNSKTYYVIAEGADGGEQVYRFPATGDETVLDAVPRVNGLPSEALKKHVWVARPAPAGGPGLILPVDWKALTRDGSAATNYHLLPGDRVYIKSRGPQPAEGARRRDAVPGGGSDPVRELEAVLEALREARSPGEQRQVVEDLERLAKRLRERLNKAEGSGRP
jgi:polysaccharide export outer membrane protein